MYAGLSVGEILETAHRLASGELLEGLDGPVAEYAGETRRDLCHVSQRLLRLDTAGTTARLLGELRRGWPWFEELWRTAEQSNTEATGATLADRANRQQERSANGATAKAKRGTVNQRMAEAIMDDPQRLYWQQPQWQRFLKCRSRSSISEAPVWKKCQAAQAVEKAEEQQRRAGQEQGRRRKRTRTN
jgi:hypothetical protein